MLRRDTARRAIRGAVFVWPAHAAVFFTRVARCTVDVRAAKLIWRAHRTAIADQLIIAANGAYYVTAFVGRAGVWAALRVIGNTATVTHRRARTARHTVWWWQAFFGCRAVRVTWTLIRRVAALLLTFRAACGEIAIGLGLPREEGITLYEVRAAIIAPVAFFGGHGFTSLAIGLATRRNRPTFPIASVFGGNRRS